MFINVTQEKRDKWKLVFVIINIMPQMLLTELVLNPEYSLKLCMTQFLCIESSASRMTGGLFYCLC